MSAAMRRALRLQSIMALLESAPSGVTVAALAEHFEVSERTIQRDLLLLQGEPLYTPLEQVTVWRIVSMRGAG